jgi:hypothetical protein
MPLLSPSDLADAIQAAQTIALPDEPFYRSVDLVVVANSGVHVLDGSHSGFTGARYHPPGSEPTAYFAGSQTLAAFECEQEQLILGVHRGARNPRVTFAITATNAVVPDLTKQLVLHAFGLTQQDLMKPTAHWRHENAKGGHAETQILGAAIRNRPDVDGMLVPSWLAALLPPGVLPRAENLVLFMDPASPTKPRRGTVRVHIHDPTGLLP